MQIDHHDHDLVFNTPIERWDEALPLGNGFLGALIWGKGSPLRISLDRADLWDLRPVPEWESEDYSYQTMRKWVAEGRINELHQLYDTHYAKPTGPTKIPSGRLEIKTSDVTGSRLHIFPALAEIQFQDGGFLETFVSATAPVGLLRFSKFAFTPDTLDLLVPPFNLKSSKSQSAGFDLEAQSAGDLTNLGYPVAEIRKSNNSRGFIQHGWGKFTYAVCVGWLNTGPDEWLIAWSVAATPDGEENDPWVSATAQVQLALGKGWQSSLQVHLEWWGNFWRQSSVILPNKTLEALWYREIYKFGSIARRDAPPISLQAVWTADQGTIPPWKGDYHHDLNTQLSYWPCYTGNHLEEGLGYLEWLWQTRVEGVKYTRHFFGLPGLNVPMTADLLGRQMGGWHQYCFSATTSAWLAHHFYLHWRYSQDRRFLQERTYPYLVEVCRFLEAITEIGPDGNRFLPLSSSPEINDDRLDAWFNPTTNYDLALIRWAFTAAVELAQELNRPEEENYWRAVLDSFPQFSYDGTRLLVAPGVCLASSHRHFSHLMAIHPLGLVNWEAGEADQRTITAALEELERLGPDWWCGYSYAWFANLAARAGEGSKAEKALEVFATAFCSPNTFHLNGDQTKSGYSKYTYRPFTLEGNFAAAAGVQEMLLQSYSGLLKVFPAVPAAWSEVSFQNLRAEGAFQVSARREAFNTSQVQIEAEVNGTVRLQNPFIGGRFTATLITNNGAKENLLVENLLDGSNTIVYSLAGGSTLMLEAAKQDL